MNNYELTLIMPGKVTPAKVKSFQEKLEKLISLGKGSIKKVEELGKIEMAYKIKKESEGNYLRFELSLPSSATRELNERLRIESDIIRYLLVRNDK